MNIQAMMKQAQEMQERLKKQMADMREQPRSGQSAPDPAPPMPGGSGTGMSDRPGPATPDPTTPASSRDPRAK